MILTSLLINMAQTIEGGKNSEGGTNTVEIPRTVLTNASIQNALQVFFGLAGGVALIIIVLSGLKYTLSRGDPGAIKKSKEAIIYALIGLVVCMSGYSFVTFVLNKI